MPGVPSLGGAQIVRLSSRAQVSRQPRQVRYLAQTGLAGRWYHVRTADLVSKAHLPLRTISTATIRQIHQSTSTSAAVVHGTDSLTRSRRQPTNNNPIDFLCLLHKAWSHAVPSASFLWVIRPQSLKRTAHPPRVMLWGIEYHVKSHL